MITIEIIITHSPKIDGGKDLSRESKKDAKLCIDRRADFSVKLSDCFERGEALPFEELWRNKNVDCLDLTDEVKHNYDIIQFSFVLLNNENKPLLIKRSERSHQITTGASILLSCSPLSRKIPRSIGDIKFYFEQEVGFQHPKIDYNIDFFGIAKNIKEGINYFFYIFSVTFPIKKLKVFTRKDFDVISPSLPKSYRQLLKGKKVDLLVLKALFPKMDIPPEEVEGCIFHRIRYNLQDLLFTTIKPEIIVVPIPNFKEDYLRVCLVQLDFSITENFPYTLRDDEKEKLKKKIFSALNLAWKEKVHIASFPELSFTKKWVSMIKKKYKNMIILCGSYYDDEYHNVCQVIVEGKEHPVGKIHPSFRYEEEIKKGEGMKSWKNIKIFATEDGKVKIGVLICIDYLHENNELYNYEDENMKGINYLFVPSFNSDIERFQKQADLDCVNHHVDIMQTNAMNYGGTCIVGVVDKEGKNSTLERLVAEGVKPDDNITYKLCQAESEMMIIANLRVKRVEVPPELKASSRITKIARYIYKDGDWIDIQQALDEYANKVFRGDFNRFKKIQNNDASYTFDLFFTKDLKPKAGKSVSLNSSQGISVVEKCNGRCVICNKKYKFDDQINFNIHHVNGDRTNTRIGNLVLLCRSCHKKVHVNAKRKLKTFMDEMP